MTTEATRATFGFPERLSQVYRRVLPVNGRTLADASHSLYVTTEELLAELRPLIQLGIARLDLANVLYVDPPPEALARYVHIRSAELANAASAFEEVARAIPTLTPTGNAVPGTGARPIDGEVTRPDDVVSLLTAWMRSGAGDISMLRPDQWRLDSESTMAQAIAEAVHGGRRVRAIYPHRVLSEAPEVVQVRARYGEQIRILPEVDTRLALVGHQQALIPEPLGVGDARHIVLREPTMVEMLARYFGLLWEQATPVPEFERDAAARADLRRMLLVQLARGAKDEQISRTLGISLRTVRRRIADMMIELGVDTRFQAGAEAARRGWL